jgi:N utilization substance protein A
LSEAVAEKLVESGVGTIERLGSMTPEQLEEIPGIDLESVEQLQAAVNAYYSQFEEQNPGNENPEETMPDPAPLAADMEASGEELAEVQGTDTGSLDQEPGPGPEPEGYTETNYPPGTLYDPESPEERFEPGSEQSEAAVEGGAELDQSATMEDAGSPSHNQSESAGAKESRGE